MLVSSTYVANQPAFGPAESPVWSDFTVNQWFLTRIRESNPSLSVRRRLPFVDWANGANQVWAAHTSYSSESIVHYPERCEHVHVATLWVQLHHKNALWSPPHE